MLLNGASNICETALPNWRSNQIPPGDISLVILGPAKIIHGENPSLVSQSALRIAADRRKA